jgi:hypothetical protein
LPQHRVSSLNIAVIETGVCDVLVDFRRWSALVEHPCDLV